MSITPHKPRIKAVSVPIIYDGPRGFRTAHDHWEWIWSDGLNYVRARTFADLCRGVQERCWI